MDADLRLCAVQVEIILPGAFTLKDRRAVVRSLLERMRRRYNVSASDLDGGRQTVNHAVLAVAAVANSDERARTVVEQALSIVRSDDRLEILSETYFH